MIYRILKAEYIIPFFLLSLIWAIFLVQNLYGLGSDCYGISPGKLTGLKGVLTYPLFHGSSVHIINNSVPLVVLLYLLFSFYHYIAYYVLVLGWLFSGFLLWLLGSLFNPTLYETCHIGASGLIYMLASFLFFSGLIKGSRPLMVISLLVSFFYGSMVWGVFPEEFFSLPIYRGNISWEGHLGGAMAGVLLSFILKNHGPQTKKQLKEKETIQDEVAELLWEKYLSHERESISSKDIHCAEDHPIE